MRKSGGTAKSNIDLTPYVARVAATWDDDVPGSLWQQRTGSLVFADISGFTALSERLAKQGPVGAEGLTEVIGRCFADLLAVAYAEGGSLLKFGGDALLLMFDGDGHARRACVSAVAMRDEIRARGRLMTTAGSVRLRMSQGVHSGELHLFRVGNSHKELLIAGPAVSTVVAMEASANAGEIVVSHETAAALETKWLGRERDAGVLLKRRTASVESAGAYVPATASPGAAAGLSPPIRGYLGDGSADSDHRNVTVGFLHFGGIDERLRRDGPDGAALVLHKLITQVQDAAAAHDVTFLATDVANDGGKVILVAGAPAAVEDADGRMLHTALQIVDGCGDLPIKIGINHGRVFAGVVGPSYRRTYTVMGDTVNLAARVMAHAHAGQVLATPAVVARARAAYDVEDLAPFVAKGKTKPVPVQRVVGVAEEDVRHEPEVPLTGREAELKVLAAAVDGARSGQGCVVGIVGEPGLGKSRLVEALRDLAGDLPVQTVVCDEYEATTPYFAFRVLLRHLLGFAVRGDVPSERVESAIALRTPSLVADLPLLGDVIGVAIPDNDTTRYLEPQYRRQRTARAVRRFLEQVQRTAILAFEDVHWIDDASSDLLREVIAAVADNPWVVVVSRRPGNGGYSLNESSDVDVIQLTPLDDDDARALVRAATEHDPLPPDRRDALVARAGGNPLFLESLLRSASSEADDAVDSIEGLLAARVDSLPANDRRVLRSASVLGASFERDLLAEISDGQDPAVVLRRLRGFLQPTRGDRVQFRHRLLRDVAYEMVPFRRRRELHARIGGLLEARYGAGEGEEVLSLHFLHAGEYGKCWKYARSAAQAAHAKFALVEASLLYQRALDAARKQAPAEGEVAETWNKLGTAYQLAGRFREANAAYTEARKLHRGDVVAVAAYCLRHAQISHRMGEITGAVRWIRRGLRLLEGNTAPAAAGQRAELEVVYAQLLLQQGKAEESLRWATSAVESAQTGESPGAVARALYAIDACHITRGAPHQATNGERSLRILEEIGNFDTAATVLNALGARSYYLGDWTKALEYYNRSIELLDRIGSVSDAALVRCNVAEIQLQQHRLDAAEANIDRALEAWRVLRVPVGLALARRHHGRLSLARGEVPSAVADFEDARATFVRYGFEPKVLEMDVWLAQCYLRLGDIEAARDLLDAVLARDVDLGGTDHRPMIHRLRAYLHLTCGELDIAQHEVEAGRSAATERADEYQVVLALQAQRDVLDRSGQEHAGIDADIARRSAELGIHALPDSPITTTARL